MRRSSRPRGEIVHLTDPLTQPAGGGAVTAAALARMGAERQFFTAAGDDVPLVAAMERAGGAACWRRTAAGRTRARW